MKAILSYYCYGDKNRVVQGTGATNLRALAKAAMLLSQTVVSELGEILNLEEQTTAHSRAKPGVDVRFIDVRIFRKLLTANTFRSSKVFLEGAGRFCRAKSN